MININFIFIFLFIYGDINVKFCLALPFPSPKLMENTFVSWLAKAKEKSWFPLQLDQLKMCPCEIVH